MQSRCLRPGPAQATDDDLLESATTSPEAFGAFYDRYELPLLRFFLIRVGAAEVAADLAAETFAAAGGRPRTDRPRAR